MGLMDFLGDVAGKFNAMGEKVMEYQNEYEGMSNEELKAEFLSIKNKSGEEFKLRRMAIKVILNNRGFNV